MLGAVLLSALTPSLFASAPVAPAIMQAGAKFGLAAPLNTSSIVKPTPLQRAAELFSGVSMPVYAVLRFGLRRPRRCSLTVGADSASAVESDTRQRAPP